MSHLRAALEHLLSVCFADFVSTSFQVWRRNLCVAEILPLTNFADLNFGLILHDFKFKYLDHQRR